MNRLIDTYLSFIKSLIPEKKVDKPSAGLDIGTHSCKLVEIIPLEDSFAILNWAIEPIGEAGAAEAVKKLLSKSNIQVKNPATAVSGQGALLRYIDMPKMPLADLKKSIEIETDRYFPFVRNQVYSDCSILSAAKEGKISVLVAAAKKDIIDQRIHLLLSLGLDVDFIGMNPIAIANVLRIMDQGKKTTGSSPSVKPEKPEAVAVLDLGDTISSVVIVKDNVPQFTRDIFIGGKELNKRISNVFGLSMPEAAVIKCNPQDKLEGILSACDFVLMNLVSEARLSLDYFFEETNTPISKLFLTGGTSLFPGVVDFFAKNLEMTVERWNPLASVKLLTGETNDEINKNANQLGVALGLALSRND